jgi:hypothetical protein
MTDTPASRRHAGAVIVSEITAPALEAARHSPAADVVGRYRTGANLMMGGEVVHLSATPIGSPASVRTSAAALSAVLTPGSSDRIVLRGVGTAGLVSTRLAAGDIRPERLAAVRAAAASALADSWFATAPAAWSGSDAVSSLAGALARDDVEQVLASAGTLLGRGIGLTPSGDDALVGVLAAATAAGLLTRGCRSSLRELIERRGTAATTTVSLTMLRCALSGHFSPDLLRVFRVARDDGDVTAAVAAVVAHGHTSGSDALFGLTTFWAAAATTGIRPAAAAVR